MKMCRLSGAASLRSPPHPIKGALSAHGTNSLSWHSFCGRDASGEVDELLMPMGVSLHVGCRGFTNAEGFLKGGIDAQVGEFWVA